MKSILSYLFVMVLFLTACTKSAQETTSGNTRNDAREIVLTRDQVNEVGMQLDTLRTYAFYHRISTFGYIDTPPNAQAVVNSRITGKITVINFIEGDYLKKGSEILVMESIEFLEMQEEYISLKSSLKFLEDDYTRQKSLSENNITARKVFLKTESDLKNMRAAYASTVRQLEILNADLESIENGKLGETLSIKAPISGFITEMNVVLGEFIDPEDDLIHMVNTDHLHAELQVFENDALKIKKGQQVMLWSMHEPDRKIKGEAYLVGKSIDTETRSVDIHVHVSKQENLMVGLYLKGEILFDEKSSWGLPVTGLIREEKGNYAYILKEKTNETYVFEKVSVETGIENGNMIEIINPAENLLNHPIAVNGVYYLSTLQIEN